MSITALARPEIANLKPYSSARSEAGMQGILLNANELAWPLLERAQAGEAGSCPLNRYPQPQDAGLLEKMAALYHLPPDHVLVTRGSDDGIDLLVRVFCSAGKDAILDCPPSFGMYRVAALTQGAAIVRIPRDPETLALDTEEILKAVSGDAPPRLVFLTSPANPTGDVVDAGFLRSLLGVAAGRSIVVVDEAYTEFTECGSFARLVGQYENLAVLRTLSKAFGSAGLRCGAVLAQPELISLLRRVMPPYPLATPVTNLAMQLFESGALERQQRALRATLDNKKELVGLLEGLDYVEKIWPGNANFVLARVADANALLEHCNQAGITIRAFPGADLLENCVRISVGSSDEMRALATALESYQSGSGPQERERPDG